MLLGTPAISSGRLPWLRGLLTPGKHRRCRIAARPRATPRRTRRFRLRHFGGSPEHPLRRCKRSDAAPHRCARSRGCFQALWRPFVRAGHELLTSFVSSPPSTPARLRGIESPAPARASIERAGQRSDAEPVSDIW